MKRVIPSVARDLLLLVLTPLALAAQASPGPDGTYLVKGGTIVTGTGEKMANGGYVELESGIPAETQRELKKRGHDVRFDVGGYGGYQAIKVEMHDGQRVYVGASESRKDGQAGGY